MTSKFINRGGFWSLSDADSTDVRDKLPPGTYTVGVHPQLGFTIQDVAQVTGALKVYGNLTHYRDRIMATFVNRPNNTGALFEGEKGSGKTMLARMISIAGLELGMPTLIINTPFKGDEFNKFMQSINQPIIVLFDEFEKVYDDEDQEAILTLLDGVYSSKKLFILTCNDTYRIDKNMKNRPGRLFYRLEFKGVGKDAIDQYCQENLDDKEQIPSIHKVSDVFDRFNFDMLKALVEEMNRYKEPASDALKMLNMRPSGGEETYNCVVSHNGVDLAPEDVRLDYSKANPLNEEIGYISVRLGEGEFVQNGKVVLTEAASTKDSNSILGIAIPVSLEDPDEEDSEENVKPKRTWSRITFPTSVPVSVKDGVLTFKIAENMFARYTRRVTQTFNFDAF